MKSIYSEKISKERNLYRDIALEAVVSAGESLLKNARKLSDLKLTYKEGQGVASDADLESEEILIKSIQKNFSSHRIYSEEANATTSIESIKNDFSDHMYWIIDPLDGTNNYLSGFPHYCICLALCELGETILGIVYNPVSGELFLSEKGYQTQFFSPSSATPKVEWPTNNNKNLEESLLIADMSPRQWKYEQDGFKELFSMSRGVRRFGSAALDMCLVAKGQMDAFWQFNLRPWDQAATTLICQQAYVHVTDINAQTIHPLSTSVIAARRPLFDRIAQGLKRITK